MKLHTITLLLTMTSSALLAQTNDSWTAFMNSDSTLTGFKDKNGIVKIEPKFTEVGFAKTFDDIMAVSEDVNGKWKSYYLTKSGRVVGLDSLHFFDNTPDCENEGFIRFRDHKSDQAGLFGKDGKIIVPAEYNDLTRVRNGMIVAIKGATKKSEAGGEHFSWAGGKNVLIDTDNKLLIDDFKWDSHLNFFSLKITDQPDPDPVRHNYKGVNGKYYSFVDFDLEFKAWLKKALPDNFTRAQLDAATFSKLMLWHEENGWTAEDNNMIVKKDYEALKLKLASLNNAKTDYHIFSESLNPMIYESEEFKSYYNNCGEAKDWIYPVSAVIITHSDKSGATLKQDHIDFLRTDNGYRLISFTR